MNDRDSLFLARAKELLEKFESLKKDPRNDDWGNEELSKDFDDICNDMIHLIYAYDPNIPIYERLKLYYDQTLEFNHKPDIEDIRKGLEYVIHYINDLTL